MSSNSFFQVSPNEKSQRYEALFQKNFCPFAIYQVLRNPENPEAPTVIFRDINPAYEEIMEVRHRDVVGRSFSEVWPLTEPQWQELIEQVIRTENSVDYQGFNKETGRYFQALGFAISSEEVAVLFLDITPRILAQEALKRKEKHLLQYKESLRNLTTRLTLAEEKTRRQIATDLHDRIGYSLATILHKLHQAKEELPEPCSGSLEEILSMLQSVIRETRSLTFEISSPLLYEVGLEAALESLGEQMLHPHDIAFSFSEAGTPKNLDPEIKVLLFQMTRELLVNVIKHAEASAVHLRIYRDGKGVGITVQDNGKGINTEVFKASESKAFGLFSIRERLRHLRGYLRVDASPGGGTEITLWAPLQTPEKEDFSR
ncbi:MAG TPA: PAS domain-containing sensor histidine kinase [Synergistaceae bacterium]|nr:PAS domain-containing sensor histidine kinase [Synergistaceae bacterium]HPJ25951.1 PAS domain-containing sensor histidine kinase [Synergistaceae bacterium]HPQ37871.1 PAS domain-containing sensor histidine kinase [Synergistaceae bacterium]